MSSSHRGKIGDIMDYDPSMVAPSSPSSPAPEPQREFPNKLRQGMDLEVTQPNGDAVHHPAHYNSLGACCPGYEQFPHNLKKSGNTF